MPLDYAKLKNRPFQLLEHRYSQRDAILYALGVGVGSDWLNEKELRFVYEDGLLALPTFASVLAYPGFWLREPDTGVDHTMVLHAEQELEIYRTLQPEGFVKARTEILDVVDKGPGKGAFIYSARTIRDALTDEPICRLRQSSVARGQGGFGGAKHYPGLTRPVPDRTPDLVCELGTLPQAALIYRLSGDFNPLHASPSVARAAGFGRPILHGMCTFGVAAYAVLKTCCDYDVERFRGISARFSAPVFPGETISTHLWEEAEGVAFTCWVHERNQRVLDCGFVRLT